MKATADLRLRLYAVVTFVLGTACVSYTSASSPMRWSLTFMALVGVAMLADALTVQLSAVSVSMTHPILAASVVLFGPAAGGLVAGLSAIPGAFLVKEKPVVRALVNVGQLSLCYTLAGLLYRAAGGRLLADAPLSAGQIPTMLLPLTVLAVAAFLLNTTLVGVAVSLNTGISFFDVWKSSFLWTIPTQAALTVLAVALAQVVASEGVLGLALFLVPLLIARQFYERYVRLRQAYAETVRSLVAVIETKDAYTRGHSERVAEYAVRIGRRLGFSEQRLERLELAALLHDLGKVGISRSILLKESRLSDDEFEVIKAHPAIGAHIIESVPFLADLVPFVSGHHERLDGSGYGSQLSAEEIPLEARVLSVADAFDAMTSSRPYRDALTRELALAEMRDCAGTQFDTAIVEAFIGVMQNDELSPACIGQGLADEAV